MSIFHLTPSSSLDPKLDIAIKDCYATELRATDLVEGAIVEASNNVTTPVVRCFNNKVLTTSAASNLVLLGAVPVGLCTGLSNVKLSKFQYEKYNPDEFSYDSFYRIEASFQWTCSLPPAGIASEITLEFYDVPAVFHNSELQFNMVQNRTNSGLQSSPGFGLINVDTSTLGQIAISIGNGSHADISNIGFNVLNLVLEFSAA
jgi:hypothetical protein